MSTRDLKQWAWEKKSELVVVLVFGALAILNLCLVLWTSRKIDAMTTILMCIAMSPLLLPLSAKYLEEFSVGINGFKGKSRQTSLPADEVKRREKAPTAATPLAESAVIPDFNQWPEEARKVLGTLWKNQREIFPKMDQRFGFKVERPSMIQPSYINGIHWLLQYALIIFDDRGFSFLSDAGIDYCQKHTAEIDKQSDLYSGFKHYFGP